MGRDSYFEHLEPDRKQAVSDLTRLIVDHYPSTSFTVAPGIDEPGATHITATVDVDDPDEVMDLVVDRLLELQVEGRLPVYVIPIRTPERAAALEQRQRHMKGSIAALRPPSLP